MVQGRSTKIISMIKWIRISKLSLKNSLSMGLGFEAVRVHFASGRRSGRERSNEGGFGSDGRERVWISKVSGAKGCVFQQSRT